ncbi:hypothetical protein GCM10007858_35980 [Bradyrhizobium liaoningense]|nr:hypothetical protein GCM10007858_35980 [Bradyrhizobium liaoningense]
MFRAIPINGRGTLTSFWGLFWILVCLHQLYFGWFMVRSSFVPYVMDGNETFSVWWHAHNLYTFSFWKSFGLTDESYGLTEASHPFFHTHQGNMPRLFGFLIYALGASTVEAQVLLTTLVIGNLTLFFCYASIAKITRPAIAFVFCLFLFSDYLLYAQWHVVTYRVWYGFLFFGTMFAIASATQQDKVWPYVLLGALFFLLFYFELVFAGYVSIIAGLLGLWQHWGKPKRIVLLYTAQLAGLIAGVGLLLLQLALALGFDVVKADFSTTFLARNAALAGAAVDSIGAFFHDHNIVFWMNFRDGASFRNIAAFARSIGTSVFQVWTPGFSLLVAAPFIGIATSFFEFGEGLRPGFSFAGWSSKSPAASGALRLSKFGPFGILVRYAAVAALLSGIFLVTFAMFRPGRLFGIKLAAPIWDLTWVFLTTMNVSLIVLFLAYFCRVPSIRSLKQYGLSLLFLLTIIGTAFAIFEVPLAQRMLSTTNEVLRLDTLALSVSIAGLVLSCFFSPSLFPVVRCTLACTLIALVLAENPALFNQGYSDVWLPLVQDGKVRMVVRAAALLAASAGIAFAFFGARRSFGSVWKIAIGRALVMFAAGLAGYATIYILSPGYVLSGYVERLAPFAIFFLAFIPATAVCAMWVAGRRCWTWFLGSESPTWHFVGRTVVPTCSIFVAATVLLLWTRVQCYYAQILPPNHAAFAKSLSAPPFKGAPFGVNNYAAVVAYYTGSWAYIDSLLSVPSTSRVDGNERRRTDPTYLWFSDWSTNSNYQNPQYYACMKMPNFDSVLALRDPKKFGNRYLFCDTEAIATGPSPFYDQLLASDSAPPRFWSVMSLGGLLPRIEGVSTLVYRSGSSWMVASKLTVAPSHTYPVTSKVVDIMADAGATTCDAGGVGLKKISTQVGDTEFSLPSGFSGTFQLRAKVLSNAGESGSKAGDIWILKRGEAGAVRGPERCPSVIADGPFNTSDLVSVMDGWGDAEPWGIWTIGRHARLHRIPVSSAAANSDFLIDAEVRAFLPGPGKKQRVIVTANGTAVATWTFSDAEPGTVTAEIPKSVMAGRSSLTLSFDISDPVSPASLGVSGDTRALGLGISRLSIREATH